MTERPREVYREPVRTRLARLRRVRPDPLKLDWTVAALLTVGAELEVWLGSGAAHERLVAAVVAPAVAGAVAIRRLYPTVAGFAVVVLSSVELGFWGDPQVISGAVAYFCALYALTASLLLTDRLELAFAARVSDLPADTLSGA